MSITGGWLTDCSAGGCCLGGIPRIWLANIKDVDVDNITRDVNNKVDTLPMLLAATFYLFETHPDSSTLNTPITVSDSGCPIFEPALAFIVKCLSQEMIDMIIEVSGSRCGFALIFETANGKRFIFGLETSRAARFTEGTIEVGATLEDANQTTLTIGAKQIAPMEELADALVIPV